MSKIGKLIVVLNFDHRKLVIGLSLKILVFD